MVERPHLDTHRSGSSFRQWEYQQLWGGWWVSVTLAQVIHELYTRLTVETAKLSQFKD